MAAAPVQVSERSPSEFAHEGDRKVTGGQPTGQANCSSYSKRSKPSIFLPTFEN